MSRLRLLYDLQKIYKAEGYDEHACECIMKTYKRLTIPELEKVLSVVQYKHNEENNKKRNHEFLDSEEGKEFVNDINKQIHEYSKNLYRMQQEQRELLSRLFRERVPSLSPYKVKEINFMYYGDSGNVRNIYVTLTNGSYKVKKWYDITIFNDGTTPNGDLMYRTHTTSLSYLNINNEPDEDAKQFFRTILEIMEHGEEIAYCINNVIDYHAEEINETKQMISKLKSQLDNPLG